MQGMGHFSIRKVYSPTLLALPGGGGGVKFPEEKRYVRLECPPIGCNAANLIILLLVMIKIILL